MATKRSIVETIHDVTKAGDSECLSAVEWMTFIGPRDEVLPPMKEMFRRGVTDHMRLMQNVCIRFPNVMRLNAHEFRKCMLSVEHEIRKMEK